MSNKIVTVDFETIPDLDLAEYLTGYSRVLDGTGPDEIKSWHRPDIYDRVKALEKYSLEKTGKEGQILPPGLNKIVAGGIHLAIIRNTENIGEWYETEHLSSIAESEPKIVEQMVGWFDRLLPRFVTYNGRRFDFPLLAIRAMRHGISMGFWFNTSDKWNNYTSRYAPDYHFDVMDFVSAQGASNWMKLEELMAVLRLPNKVYGDTHGGKVLELWIQNQTAVLREYSELDCLNTFLCYIHCQYLRGAISLAGRDTSLRSVIAFLMKHRDQLYLDKFLNEWIILDPFIQAECGALV